VAALAAEPAATAVTELRLLRLTLKNFKGCRNLTVEPNGEDLVAYGKNGTGKTTLGLALIWLFTGKDFENKQDHEIKTKDADHNVIQGLEHEVEGVFSLNGKQITFKRIYCENWGTVRGAAQEVMKGNTTKYFLNDVGTSEAAYNAKVASLCDPKVLPALLNLSYFNRILKPDKRREILIDMCGDVTDADVVASNSDLKDLPGILGDRTCEEHYAWAEAQQKKAKEERETIPTRISEARRSIPEAKIDKTAVEAELARLRANRQALQEELTRITNGAQATELKRQISEIDTEINAVRNRLATAADAKRNSDRDYLSRLESQYNTLNRKVNEQLADIDGKKLWVAGRTTELADYRVKFEAIKLRSFTAPAQIEVCPACQQSIPEERLEEVRRKALEEFNLAKSADLEKNQTDGKALAKRVKDAQEIIDGLEAALAQDKAALTELRAKVEAESDRLSAESSANAPTEEDPAEITVLKSKKAGIEEQLGNLAAGSETESARVRSEVSAIDDQIRAEEVKLAQVKVREEAEARVAELDAREKVLAAQYEEFSRHIHLIKLFTQTKVRMLDEKISSRFERVKFQLFEIQINGGLKNKCECIMDGRPYDGALSTGERVLADLDVVNTLSRHYGFICPTVIDNLESVTSPVPTVGQQIRLVVSAADATLRFEQKETH
jgi:DNA repair exonuclease SbcCD ATPase subunit